MAGGYLYYLMASALAVVAAGVFWCVRSKKHSFEYRLSLCLNQLDAPLNFLAPFQSLQQRFSVDDQNTYLQSFSDIHQEAELLLQDFRIKGTRLDVQPLRSFDVAYRNIDNFRLRNNRLYDAICFVKSHMDDADHQYTKLFDGTNYLPESVKNDFKEDHLQLFTTLQENLTEISQYIEPSLFDKCQTFVENYQKIDEKKVQYNLQYVEDEKVRLKEYFDTVLQYPLSDQQREAIIKAEDNCLVISAAGSGKTSTMEGKIKYLVEQKGIDPSRLLTITYTRKAADSLTTRLNMPTLRCVTFHKFSLDLIGQIKGIKPSICDDAKVNDLVYSRLIKQPDFLKSVNKYLFDFLNPVLSRRRN